MPLVEDRQVEWRPFRDVLHRFKPELGRRQLDLKCFKCGACELERGFVVDGLDFNGKGGGQRDVAF